jgi:hypothetical protein
MALKDAIKDIVDELQTITDLRRVPDAPPENNDQFPFAVVYPLTGVYTQGPAQLMKGLHSVNIELHVARKDLPRDYAQIGPLSWSGVETLGVTYTINNVKVETEIT